MRKAGWMVLGEGGGMPGVFVASQEGSVVASLQAVKRLVFFFVGKLVGGHKGINEHIQSFTSLSPKFPHLKQLWVGPTEPNMILFCLQPKNKLKSIIKVFLLVFS